MEYIRVDPKNCHQTRDGRLGTPCFREMTEAGVIRSFLCPEALANETDEDAIWDMLNDGTCLMDERNPSGMRAYFEALSKGSSVVNPEP